VVRAIEVGGETRRHVSWSVSTNFFEIAIPAAFTRTLQAPSWSSHSRTAARHSSSFVTSAVTQIPAEASQASTSGACSGFTDQAATRAPSPMKARAMAARSLVSRPLTSYNLSRERRPDCLVPESCILGMMSKSGVALGAAPKMVRT